MNPYDLAKRITSLESRNENEACLVTFAFGATYALAQAKELGYTDRGLHDNWKDRVKEARLLASNLHSPKRSRLEKDNQWLAGFHFNNALFRTDVGFERVTRHIALDALKMDDWRALSDKGRRAGLPSELIDQWKRLRAEVVAMKHHNAELFKKDRMSYGEAFEALDRLISAIQWCFEKPSDWRKQRAGRIH
jgi:hypothetical protein